MGYLFGEPTARTVAHELMHGVFKLEHTFSSTYGVAQGSTSNLMDYVSGATLVKHQWDCLYSPGVVIGMFEGEEDGMSENTQWYRFNELWVHYDYLDSKKHFENSYASTVSKIKCFSVITNSIVKYNKPLMQTPEKQYRVALWDDVNLVIASNGGAGKKQGFLRDLIINIQGCYKDPDYATIFEEFFHAASEIYYKQNHISRNITEIELEEELAEYIFGILQSKKVDRLKDYLIKGGNFNNKSELDEYKAEIDYLKSTLSGVYDMSGKYNSKLFNYLQSLIKTCKP